MRLVLASYVQDTLLDGNKKFKFPSQVLCVEFFSYRNGGIPLECQIDLRHGIEKLVLLRTTDTKHNCVNLTFKAFVELDKMGFIPSLWDLF